MREAGKVCSSKVESVDLGLSPGMKIVCLEYKLAPGSGERVQDD